jgi:hypothetical protein
MLYLFGSRAAGTHKSYSDIDVLLCGWDDIIINELEPYSLWNDGPVDMRVYHEGKVYSPHCVYNIWKGNIEQYPLPCILLPIELKELLSMCKRWMEENDFSALDRHMVEKGVW